MKFKCGQYILLASAMAILLGIGSDSTALHSLFQSMDRNGDGKIEKGEFSAYMTGYAFKKIDDNDSEVITVTEWDLIENVRDREQHKELFKQVDGNEDKVISPNEFSAYADKHSNIMKAFTAHDSDGNGVLMPEEITVRPLFRMVTVQFE